MCKFFALAFYFLYSISSFGQILSYENISESLSSSSSSKMMFDKNYNIHITWIDSTNQIFYRYKEGNFWNDKVLLYESDSTEITDLAISSYHDSIKIFWIEKGNSFKIKSITPLDTAIVLLYESQNELQNLKGIGNSSNSFVVWFEKGLNLCIKSIDLTSKDTLTIGNTISQFSYSTTKDDSDRVFIFWISGDYSISYRSFNTFWSEKNNIVIEDAVQPLNEMDCTFNESYRKFCFVFTCDIPTCCGNYPTGLYYFEGIDTTWSALTSLDPPILHCTNPQIEIYEGDYSIILYQEGYGKIPSYMGTKFYFIQKGNEYNSSDTLLAPDSSYLNDFTSDGNSLFCSFQKDGDIFFAHIDIITPEVENNPSANGIKFYLDQNYPNPFNPSTKIKYTIPHVETGYAPSVRLVIYDILGKEVVTLVDKQQRPGNYEVVFNAASVSRRISSGTYFYKLSVGNFTSIKKMVLLK